MSDSIIQCPNCGNEFNEEEADRGDGYQCPKCKDEWTKKKPTTYPDVPWEG